MVTHIVLVECDDTKGLIHAITGVLFALGCNIENQDEFVDKDTNRFFMRTEIAGLVDSNVLIPKLVSILPPDAKVRVSVKKKKRIAILGSVEPHCIGDLLIRHKYGELQANIEMFVSNHESLGELATKFNVPFYYVPDKRANGDSLSREEHEAELLKILEPVNLDYLVLAKYMRILTPDFVNRFPNKMVNIHHSFLPAFIGAHPYRKAFERGVKIIGATAHFVTADLDCGPIISQGVVRINHAKGVKEMMQQGRNVEKIVLAEALRLVFADRVFVHQNRTIIFD